MKTLQANEIAQVLPKDSWLAKWVKANEWLISPTSFVIFSGMAMIGAAVGRRAWHDCDYRKLWPMFNVLLIGPSGVGKSTAASEAIKLIEHMKDPAERPQVFQGITQEKLHEDLAAQPKAVFFASELASSFNKQRYLDNLIPYITEVLDYRDFLERRTKSGRTTIVNEPAMVVLGCSTVPWLQEQLPSTAVSGGFLARFMIVNEHAKSKNINLPMSLLVTKKQYAEMQAYHRAVCEEFEGVVASAQGDIPFEDMEQAHIYDIWATNFKASSGVLEPFAARAQEQVRRMAMLIAISRGKKSLWAEDIEAAIALYEYCMGRLEEVMVAYNQGGRLVRDVMDYVGDSVIPFDKAIRGLLVYGDPNTIYKLVEGLIKSGKLRMDEEGNLRRGRT